MTPDASSSTRRIAVALDVVAVAGSAVAAFAAHAVLRERVHVLRDLPGSPRSYAALALLVLPLWIGIARVLRLHEITIERWPLRRIAARLVALHVLGFFAISTLLFVTQLVINRSVVGLFLASSFASMLAVRLLLLRATASGHATEQAETRILLVGSPTDEMRAWTSGLSTAAQPPRIVGRLGEDGEDEDEGTPALRRVGHSSDLVRVLEEQAVDHVVFFPPHHRPEEASALLAACEDRGVPASFLIALPKPATALPRVFEYYERPFVTFELAPRSPELLAIKHGFDFLVALVLVILLSPLLLVGAVAVLLTMGRPVLFIQSRAGRTGRSFRMLKFRTMVAGADAKQHELHAEGRDGPIFKLANDPRVTPLGRLLRRFSFDELPQLLNVLAGSMSLVGPRPLPLDEQQAITGWHRRRLAMKPGITGLWQVSGRSDVPYSEWMLLDVRYVDTWSLRLDAQILAKTLPAVLARRGAY
jgi:exopolysaccharide biosynthesis polyprenyl glycosylphosphotransferase